MNIYKEGTTRSSHSNSLLDRRSFWNFYFVGILAVLLSSCASSPRFTNARSAEPTVNGTKAPSSNSSDKKTSYQGIASYYAHDFHGKKTANGESYDMYALTAAHRSFPFNTKVRVTNSGNGKSCIVRVNDRGPFKLERIMDLSLGAAEVLGMTKSGTANVTLEVVEWGN